MIKLIQDWTAVRKMKAGLLDALRQTRPGAGVTVSNAKNPIVARCIIEILRENVGSIEATDHGESITLMRKVDQHKTVGAKYDELVSGFDILNAQNITSLGLGNKAELPAHVLRTDFDYQKFNGNGPDWSKFDRKKKDDLADLDQSIVLTGGGK